MGGPKTRRHSSVEDKLPPEIRAQVDRALIEGATYDDLEAFCREQGHDISRSALGRYGKRFLETLRELRIMEDQSRVLVSEAGGDGMILDEATSKLLTAAALKMAQGQLDLKELTSLMHAAANLQSASVRREQAKSRLVEEAKKRAEAAADAVAKKAKAGGLSRKTAEEMRDEVLGVIRG